MSKDELNIQRSLLEKFESTADWSLLISQYKDSNGGISILDALAASGLRSIRYWKEIPLVQSVTINDLDPAAIDLARENITFNDLSHVLLSSPSHSQPEHLSVSATDTTNTGPAPKPPSGIRLQLGDATHEMYLSRRPPNLQSSNWSPTQMQQKSQYHVIDLDPYGSAAMFLDAAVQAVVDGGLLAITCTDMRVLGGSNPELCFQRYSSVPLSRSSYLQEMALRMLLYSLATTASKYGRAIKPILSVGMHFYVRVFVEIWDDKASVSSIFL